MVAWIPPLQLETWIINVFSGNPEVFIAVALFVIIAMASFFRMNTLNMFLMAGIFILMFSGYITSSFVVLFGIIGGLLVGYVLSKILQ